MSGQSLHRQSTDCLIRCVQWLLRLNAIHTCTAFYTLTDDLKPIASKWNTFGVYLDIEDDVLDTIEANVNKGEVGKVDYCFKSTLRQWLKGDNPTKNDLCSALKNIGEKELARRLNAGIHATVVCLFFVLFLQNAEIE